MAKKNVSGIKAPREAKGGKGIDKAKNVSLPEIFLAALLVIGIANIIYLYSMSAKPGAGGAEKAPKIDATIIYSSSCDKCFNASLAITAIEKIGAKVEIKNTLDASSSKAATLIKKYNITKVPTVLFSGDTEKNANVKAALEAIGEKKSDGTIVLAKINPPYYDTFAKKVVGLVTATGIEDASCLECYDPMKDVSQLENLGVVFGEKETFDYTSARGEELVAKYKIADVPALLFSGDISAYEGIAEGLAQAGTFESDGTFVLRNARPPYRNLSTGNVDGITGIAYLSDASCTTCYNVSVHKAIVQRLGVYIGNETTADVNSTAGKSLISKYNITLVPTIILSKEASLYPAMIQVWPEVGTIEADGAFVFRDPAAMGASTVYKNLTSGKIIGSSNSTA